MGKWKPLRGATRARGGAVQPACAIVGRTAMSRRAPGYRVAASAIIVELMNPIRRLVDVSEEKKPLETLALLCAAAWNASRLVTGGEDSRAAVEVARNKVAEMEPAFVPMFEVLLARAGQMYPADRRMITSVTVDIGGGEMRVHAASVGGDD